MEQKKLLGIIKKNLPLTDFDFSVFYTETQNCIAIEFKEFKNQLFKEIGCVILKNSTIENYYCFITVLEIETILCPLLRKHGLIGGKEGELMITSSLQKLDPELFNSTLNPAYPKVIESEEDVIDLLNDLNNYTTNVAEPFFEKWSDLRILNDFLDNCPQMEISNYLGGYGAYSKLLIYKLCNNPKYEEYFTMMYNFAINRYKENPNGDQVIKQTHDFMIDFKEILDKTEAIYNVE